MQTTRIDLHVRRPEDLATLTPIRDAFQRRGVEVVLSVDSRDWPNPSQDAVPGPVPCDIRVLVAGGGKPPVADEARLAVVEGRIDPKEVRSIASDPIVIQPYFLHGVAVLVGGAALLMLWLLT